MKLICSSTHKGLKPSPWIASRTLRKGSPPGNPASDTAAVRIINDRINEIVYKKGGKVTQVLTNVLAPDGNTIGIIYMRADAEGKTTNVTFATYERQP